MIEKDFDINKFRPFPTSSGLGVDSTGIYEDKVVRIFRENFDIYKSILEFSDEFEFLIGSNLFYEDENVLVVQHDQLENITYFNEWTRRQKVIASKAIVELQIELIKKGYYLNDPHSFNITFKYHQPVYFDFGSIRQGYIRPTWWFIKCFCGWTEMDYWDNVLKINFFQKLFVLLRISLSRLPYEYLLKKLSKFETGFFEKNIINLLNRTGLVGRLTRKVVNGLPLLFSYFSNWTDYEQKSPKLDFDNARNKNILSLFNQHKPKKILDIGANKGAFSLLALNNGSTEAIAIDLDNYSLDYLLNQVKINNHKITIARLNIMNYPEHPGYYQSYLPAHERLNCNFTICLAVVHHVCYFGESSFEEFGARLDHFTKKILVVEFVPYDDIHLSGPTYKGKDRSWYTLENFVNVLKKWFPGEHETFESSPTPRVLIKFCK
jgi:SAM-dependent methyltransferase